MPFINVKTNAKLTKQQELQIKSVLGESIANIPGKTEARLMVCIEDEMKMYFKGADDNVIVFVEVSLFGSASKENYKKLNAALTKELCDIVSAEADNIYIKFSEISNWGAGGRML